MKECVRESMFAEKILQEHPPGPLHKKAAPQAVFLLAGTVTFLAGW